MLLTKRMFIVMNKNVELCLYMANLTFIWYDILVEKGSLHRNGMAAISKIKSKKIVRKFTKFFFVSFKPI